MNKLTQEFKNPSNEYRPLPFWSWNDRLEAEKLQRQLHGLADSGVGGYFMHARAGIITDYLSEDWFKCVGACIESGKKHAMESWLYDESGWPSGFAGGLVTALGDEYHSRGLVFETPETPDDIHNDSSVLGVYLYNKTENTIKRIDSNEAAVAESKYPEEQLVVVRHTAGPYYIDVLNRKAVRAFIDFTHQKYYDRFGDDFGKAVQGFFTDEPRLSQGDIPWSYTLPEKFRQKYNYNIIDILPSLFICCKGFEKSRYDFWQLVSELFVTSFMKQIYDWCVDHHCKLTGHVMMEESIYSQMTGTSGSMPFYEYMSMPGMDWLRRMIWNPIIPKQVSSVACQMGKKHVLTESYALCGWNVSFEELKWIAEWQYVNGVNRMCQHLFAYSLQGFRKRDYPPSHFYQQSWWPEYKRFNDYLSRLGVLLTSGKGVVDVLVLHPMRSGWVAYDGTNNETLKKLDADFAQLAQTLSSLHIDYHFGDETYIKKYGKAVGNKIIIGQCSYKAVVLPSMLTCDKATAQLLCTFIKNGGKVISYGDLPKTCNGEAGQAVDELNTNVIHIGSDADALYDLLKRSGASAVSIRSNGTEISDISYQERDINGTHLVFMVNHSREKSYRAVVTVKCGGKANLIDIENGTKTILKEKQADGLTQVELEFLPMQSHMLLCGDTELLELPQATPTLKKTVTIGLPKTWSVACQDMNSMTLDFCDCSVDDGDYEANVPVIRMMDKLLALKRSCNLKLRFRFEADLDLSANKQLMLVLETPEKFKITVNGSRLDSKSNGWWKDESFKTVDIKPLVQNGINEIILECKFYESQKVYDVLFGENVYETELNKLTYDTEIENVYLVGDFGVFSKSGYTDGERRATFTDGPFVLKNLPRIVEKGDLTKQGYAFFAGSLRLEQRVNIKKEKDKQIFFDIGVPDAVLAKLYVNGIAVKTVTWRPFGADITNSLLDGENTIGVELFAGNRNLLGPHHHTGGELYNVGPESFKGKWSWCDRLSEAVEANKNDMTKDYWQDKYCMVRFGFKDNK